MIRPVSFRNIGAGNVVLFGNLKDAGLSSVGNDQGYVNRGMCVVVGTDFIRITSSS